jgi:hypothetical protein
LYVLLDANIIIEAHMQGVWASLIQRATIVIPSIVLREAQGYHDLATGEYIPIHLEEALATGLIREIAASVEQLAELRTRFDSIFVQRMDPGESEALALLLAGALPGARFCTADGPAIRALSLLQMADMGVSFEALLHDVGLQHRLRNHFSERFFREMRERGAQEFIRGEGLRRPGPDTRPKARRRGRPKRKP